MIIIKYSNTTDIDGIRFADGYIETLYVDAVLDKPEYPVIIEGDENGDLANNPTFRKWEKKFSFSFIALEFKVDAVSKLPIYDSVTIIANGVTYEAKNIVVETDWQDESIYALVGVEFTDKYIINRITNENMN